MSALIEALQERAPGRGEAVSGGQSRDLLVGRNGSIWNPKEPLEVELPEGTEDIELEGSNANHHVHRFGARLLLHIGDTWGIGADARLV